MIPNSQTELEPIKQCGVIQGSGETKYIRQPSDKQEELHRLQCRKKVVNCSGNYVQSRQVTE